MTAPASISGVILAGGRASRMQEQDKGLLSLAGRPLIEYVIDALRPQVDRILINANRNLERYRSYGFPVIEDSLPDYPGPLAGMLTALQQTDSRYTLSVPCDGPWLPTDLLQRLYLALRDENAEISCVHDGERLHPVFALLDRSIHQALTDYLKDGGRGVQKWFRSRRLAQVDFSDCPELFANINTAEELSRIESEIRTRHHTQPTTHE